MNIFESVSNLVLFLIFFIPGFVSIKIYDLLIPSERRDFSKAIVEVVSYSAFNFAAFSWLIWLIYSGNFYQNYPFWSILSGFLIFFVFPAAWPVIFLRLLSIKWIAEHVRNPIPKPWDYVFGKKEDFWVIIHLKDGRRIGGMFGLDSYAAAYPLGEDIYLEEVWTLDDNGSFIRPVDRSRGIMIFRESIQFVELFGDKKEI